jgi:hypothetical protein
MTLRQDPEEAFARFLAAFPERDGGHDRDATLLVWQGALRRADAETIIAGARAYAEATAGRPRRFIMSPRRWLAESHWRDTAARHAPRLIFVSYGSRQWSAWDAFYRTAKGKSPPQSRKGGWWFSSEFPPHVAAE